jgi:hypothetical protein
MPADSSFKGSASYRGLPHSYNDGFPPMQQTAGPGAPPAITSTDRLLAEARRLSTPGRHMFMQEGGPAVRKVLNHFDRVYANELSAEARCLADGGGLGISNSALPVSVTRAVIREALSDLNVLQVCSVYVDPLSGASMQIPYETCLPGAIVNDGIVYENQEIPFASVRQDMFMVYAQAMKLAFSLTNEVDFLSSRNGFIDWNAADRLVASNARIIKERIHMRIANEMQRAADAFQAETVSAENIASQLTGSASLIKTARFPVVKPHQTRDIRGTAIGSEENPLTLIVNGAAVAPFDGTSAQPDGLYWIAENLNLGYFRLVNPFGAAVAVTASSACTISYSAATNCALFDLKLPEGLSIDQHMNGALRAIGARQSVLRNKRLVEPDFICGSGVLFDQIGNATYFSEQDKRRATELDLLGCVTHVKGMKCYSTNAPGVNFKDDRLLIGQRDTCSYVISKPWSTTPPFEAKGPNGLPTAEKIAYGEEYNAICVPTPIRSRLTSIIVYDSDARSAAA